MQVNTFDEKLEIEVLNAMLNSHDALVIGLTHLETESFVGTYSNAMYKTIQGLVKKNIKIDRNNIATEYKNNSLTVPACLNKLDKPETNDVYIKVETLKNYTILRKLKNLITESPGKMDIWNFRNTAMHLSMRLNEIISGNENEVIPEWMVRNSIVNQIKNGEKRKVIATGIWQIDDIITGFGAGNIIAIAARPAMGKTAFAMQLALNNRNAGHVVGFLSLEMSNEEIAERIIANELKVAYKDVQERKIPIETLSAYSAGYEEKIKFVKNQNIKIDQLAPLVRSMVKVDNCEIIYIDHLEKLYDHSPAFKKHERIGYIMDQLKIIAQDLEIPIVVMQQINRGGEENKGSRPTLADIKSSGSVEEWSSVVMLLHRPEYYDRENATLHGLFEVDVAKNRFGPTGIVKLTFDAQFMRFESRGY